jgi:sugar fermentation stimulation protein A
MVSSRKKSGFGLKWPELIPGVLIKRYKRFLADVQLETGETVTAHCPNSGSMKACSEPGRPVYVSFHDNPKRKLKYTWELIGMPTSLVGVNTQVPNRLVAESVDRGMVKELKVYDRVRREVKVGGNSRIDLVLEGPDRPRCFVEIKNCTLVDGTGNAAFPDAVTARGLKHLKELQKLVKAGNRCVMFYLIQRMDASSFRPADEIDPAYGKGLRKAVSKGVEILAYDVHIDLAAISLNKVVPYRL